MELKRENKLLSYHNYYETPLTQTPIGNGKWFVLAGVQAIGFSFEIEFSCQQLIRNRVFTIPSQSKVIFIQSKVCFIKAFSYEHLLWEV